MFKIADPLRDAELGEAARDGAEQLLAADPMLTSREHKPLHGILQRRYARALELFRVG